MEPARRWDSRAFESPAPAAAISSTNLLIGDLGGAPRRRKQLLPAMTAHRGALCVATGAALLLLAALPGCRLAHKESRWSEAMRDWAHLAEAQAAAWWAVHRPAAVAALPPRPPAAPHARAGLSRPLAQPLTVMLQLPDHRELQLREDETLESLVAKLLQEQVGGGQGPCMGGHVQHRDGVTLHCTLQSSSCRPVSATSCHCPRWLVFSAAVRGQLPQPGLPSCMRCPHTTCPPFSRPLPPSQAGLHPTAIELVSIEQVTQQRTSPFRAVLRAVAALREPATQTAAVAASEDGNADVAALTADPALQQLAAGSSAAARLLSDVGSAHSDNQARHALQGGRRDLSSGRKLRQQVRSAVLFWCADACWGGW